MSAETAGEQAKTLPCERCGRPIPQNSTGGPRRRMCKQSPDHPGKSCREVADAERDALARVGLGEAATALRPELEALRELVGPFGGAIAALEARLAQIEQVALDQVQDAHDQQLRAEAAQRTAEREAREAEQRTTRAYEVRDEAMAERDLAVEDAGRYQREADAAISRAVEAEHRRGQAEGAATEQRRALDAEVERRTAAEVETDRLRAQVQAQQRELAQVRDELVDAERRVGEAGTRALAAEAEIRSHETEKAALQAQAARDAAALEQLRREHEELDHRLRQADQKADAAAQRADAVRSELDTVRAEAQRRADDLAHQVTAAEQARDDAERRYTGLLAALAGGGFTATAGDQPATGERR
ncbi:coiled-coil domain-containing protein [Couchioplanes caeruleus]|nr:hypothetical protein [Couchioplanes caeruleus]